MCKILIAPESKAGFVITDYVSIAGEADLFYSSLKPYLIRNNFQTFCAKKEDSKFSCSSLLLQKEKLNIINNNATNNNVGLNSNKTDEGV